MTILAGDWLRPRDIFLILDETQKELEARPLSWIVVTTSDATRKLYSFMVVAHDAAGLETAEACETVSFEY